MNINQWGTIKWATMKNAFAGAVSMIHTATDQPNLSNVTSMFAMFSGASKFDSDISGWDVSNVEIMGALFNEASVFNSPLNGWVVSSATDLSHMFSRATKFNQPLNTWDVRMVETSTT